MEIKVSGRKTTVTDALRAHVDEKIGEALKVFDIEPMTADVVLRYEKNPSNPNPAIVEVTVRARGSVIRVAEHGADMYAAIDLAADKVTRQLRKFKTRVVDNRQQGLSAAEVAPVEPVADLADLLIPEEEDDQLVRVKEIELTPMTEEQALVQTDLLGHDFYVFENSTTGLINVVYHRKNGGYGIIKPKLEEFTDDIWSTITPKEFYDKLRAGSKVSTSAVSLGRYIEFFTQCAEEGTPTVYLCFTSALSSSYNSACQAADCVRAEHPDFELYVVDNALPCSCGELLAMEAVRQRAAGLSAHQLADWANEAKTYVHGYFTLDGLDALAAGGRIPPAAASLSSKLDIKPELSFDLAGSLSLIGVNRGRKKALKSLVKSFKENYELDPSLPLAIVSSDAEKDADWLEGAVRKEPGCEDLTILRGSVGPTIGAHVGPGMVALIFWGKNRADKISLTDRIANRVRGE